MKKFLQYAQIAGGTLLGALAVNLFLVPNQLPSGGMGGLILLMHYLWQIPMGPAYLAANLPALFWLLRLYGVGGLMKTLCGILSFSLFLELTEVAIPYAPTENLLLATIYSGVLLGLGMGLTLRVGGSTGGTSSIGKVVHHYTGLDIGKFMLVTDLLILGASAFILSAELVLYGVLGAYILTRTVRVVLDGFSTSRCLLIISERPDAVSAAIMAEIKRGVTRLDGMGEYTGQPRPVLMCVVGENEVSKIKRLVLAADRSAFVLITDAREVAGKGFTVETEIRRIGFWAAQGGD